MTASSQQETELRARIRRREVVTELGQRALENGNLDRIMHDAAAAVAETLDNDYCKVLELLPGGDEVFLRRGVGWRDGLVGNGTVPTDLDSQARYTPISEEPIIVEDIQRLHGRIWVESESGEGSRFSFTLPDVPGADD